MALFFNLFELKTCEISGSHCGEYEDSLLGYGAV
jgi:hypothetical protein